MTTKQPRTAAAADRISGLPEPIIHHILNFLYPNIKDIKKTSSLSKSWYHFSSTFPFLDFHHSPYKHHTHNHLNFIHKTLQKFHRYNNLNIPIQTLTIPIIINDYIPSMIYNVLDKWIELVLQRGANDFNLRITDISGIKIIYNLPKQVFAANSLTKVAKLDGISLLHSFPDGSSNYNLLKLHLHKVVLDELTLSCVISSCPLIEEMFVIGCLGVKHVRISNLDKLRTLRLGTLWFFHLFDQDEKFETVEIDAPNLESLEIKGSLKIRVLDCPRLTKLDLHKAFMVESSRLEDILSRLSFLRSLSLFSIVSLTKVKVSSDTLNKVIIFGCNNLKHLEIDAPDSVYVKYTGDFAPLACSNNVTGRWDVCTYYHGFDDILNFSLEKLKERVVDQPVATTLDHLWIKASDIYDSDLFDGVLWSCHPRTLSVELDDRLSVVMRICTIIRSHRGHGNSRTRSWLRCLEDARYVSQEGNEEDHRLPMDGTCRSYLLCSSHIKFIFNW